MDRRSKTQTSTETAIEAVQRGYQPVPIRAKQKIPTVQAWTRLKWDTAKQAEEDFRKWHDVGMTNVGVLLGEPSGGLVDVDLDHPKTVRLKDHFLPMTPMRTGRTGSPNSHYWYKVKPGTLQGTRRHKMPDGSVSVELRSTGAQTVIPPSVHPSGERYRWQGSPWGGDEGPLEVDGQELALRVALLGMTTAIIENWPEEGGRHEAYLALVGGLLRRGDHGVEPVWRDNIAGLVAAIVEATGDEEGADSRIHQTVRTTIKRLEEGSQPVAGFGKLAEIVGDSHASLIRAMSRDIVSTVAETTEVEIEDDTPEDDTPEDVRDKDPLSRRVSTWEPVDLDEYLSGEIQPPVPDVMYRNDGDALMYRGRVNMLYGASETAKSLIALHTCLQEIQQGQRVIYLDFEDEPENTLHRLKTMGADADDVKGQFAYIRPEDPFAAMQRNRWGQASATDVGRMNQRIFEKTVSEVRPSLVVADGMTSLYGLHGLDSNDSVSTEIITSWLKTLTVNNTTVIVIDHTSKNAAQGTLPIGSQHKTAMVQGTLLQVWPVKQPVKGSIGELELTILKDRPGEVRKIGSDKGSKVQVGARVVVDSTVEDVTDIRVEPPKQTVEEERKKEQEADLRRSRDAARAQELRDWEDRIKVAYRGELGTSLTMSEIRERVDEPDHAKKVTAAVKRLVDQGWLFSEGKTKGRKYTLQVGDAGYGDE